VPIAVSVVSIPHYREPFSSPLMRWRKCARITWPVSEGGIVRPKGSGLFNGWWLDMAGKKLRRIRRNEYPELYRLHRVCSDYEKERRPIAKDS
jgi:hypothetical protein